jgi:hypothetical protein
LPLRCDGQHKGCEKEVRELKKAATEGPAKKSNPSWERFARTINVLKRDHNFPSGSDVVMHAMERAFPSIWRDEDAGS